MLKNYIAVFEDDHVLHIAAGSMRAAIEIAALGTDMKFEVVRVLKFPAR